MKKRLKKLDVFHIAYYPPSSFILSVVTDRRSVTESKDGQKSVSFDFAASQLRSGQTVFKNFGTISCKKMVQL
jgi:hypothetical protein